jgi:phosphoribosylformylglycinamidine synthase
MEPFEIMISESQERMLCVVAPDVVGAVLDVCQHWEVTATPIGAVTGLQCVRVFHAGSLVADLPVHVLVDDCPLYDLEPIQPAVDIYPAPVPTVTGGETPAETLLALLSCANVASRRQVFEQYDPIVQSRTVRRPEEADAAVLALAEDVAIAVSIDGNGRRVACDPRRGAAEAVYECAANLACVGAEPLGLTNCLNFGNPEKPHVAWQLTQAVNGLAEACRSLGVPVVGGNVSLYNEGPTGPIFPTPVVGIVGLVPDPGRTGRLGFLRAGDAIALVGSFTPSLEGSELAKLRGQALRGPLPEIDPEAIGAALEWVRSAVRQGWLSSAHDVAEGGLAVAVAECAIAGGLGATIELPPGLEPFGEAPGRAFVVSGPRESLERQADEAPVPVRILGAVGGPNVQISGSLDVAVSELDRVWRGGLTKFL